MYPHTILASRDRDAIPQLRRGLVWCTPSLLGVRSHPRLDGLRSSGCLTGWPVTATRKHPHVAVSARVVVCTAAPRRVCCCMYTRGSDAPPPKYGPNLVCRRGGRVGGRCATAAFLQYGLIQDTKAGSARDPESLNLFVSTASPNPNKSPCPIFASRPHLLDAHRGGTHLHSIRPA